MAPAGSLLLFLASVGSFVAATPNDWYHPRDHPVSQLFQRQSTAATANAIGSAAWTAAYPQNITGATVPAPWQAAYNAAVAAGKIPNIAPTTLVNGNPTYANGQDPNNATICSATYACRGPAPIEYWDAIDGVIGISFDDGPLPPSPALYDFLKANNQQATHFFIGLNILQNPTEFAQCVADTNQHIAVHTFTHPYMTTKSDTDVLLELGWTMQIIADSTGGRVPKYFRPPYGDTDNRVRAIAWYVFGLTTVVWNQDSNDWQIGTNANFTLQSVEAQLQIWFSSTNKTPGLIVLEHELMNETVDAFIANYPLLAKAGWKTVNIPDSLPSLASYEWYQNSFNSTAPVTPLSIGSPAPSPAPSSPPPAASVSVAAGASASAVPGGSSKPASNSKNGAGSNAALFGSAVFSAALCSLLFW